MHAICCWSSESADALQALGLHQHWGGKKTRRDLSPEGTQPRVCQSEREALMMEHVDEARDPVSQDVTGAPKRRFYTRQGARKSGQTVDA